jgi:hypothetical protein
MVLVKKLVEVGKIHRKGVRAGKGYEIIVK